jgi:hypothetical protein
MTYKEAIDLMKTSRSVAEWNLNRITVKLAFPFKSFDQLKKSPLPEIDCMGLITKVLTKAVIKTYEQELIKKQNTIEDKEIEELAFSIN